MGTVEKIVDTIKKMTNERKDIVSKDYSDYSLILRNEFLELKQKILNPRASSSPGGDCEGPAVEAVNQVSVKNEVIAIDDNQETRKEKRKSPELSQNSTRGSPLAKRSSADFAEIAVASGLPSDINKLKKEELLHELEIRGNCTMTMRAKKQDLVDALKLLVLDIHQRKSIPEISVPPFAVVASEMSSVPPASSASSSAVAPAVVAPSSLPPSSSSNFASIPSSIPLSAPSPSPLLVERKPSIGGNSPARKISILAEARNHVNGVRASLLIDKNETDEVKQSRLAKEYEARRNRSSQVRMSQLNTPSEETTRPRTVSVESNTSITEQKEESHEEENHLNEQHVTVDEIHLEEERQEEVLDQENDDISEPNDENDNWNEVPSPPHDIKVNNQEGNGSTTMTSSSFKLEEETQQQQQIQQHTFKLSNLIGGTQLSFLSSSSSNQATKAKDKPKVSALEQAQRQKEKDEARAAQKKKELEDKKRELEEKKKREEEKKRKEVEKKEQMKKMQSSSATSTTTTMTAASGKLNTAVPTPAPTTTTATTTSASSTATATTATATAASSQKKGFGWFRKDKDAIVTAPISGKGKDMIFAPQSSSQSSSVINLTKEQTEVIDVDQELEDQENHHPGVATIKPTIPFTTTTPTPAPVNVLTEKKTSIPLATLPTTPVHNTQMQSPITPLSANSYEPSPQPISTTASHTATATNSSPPQPQYQIEEREDSDGSDTDGESEQQNVPDWAKQPKLRQALERQYGLIPGVPAVDPDTIFPDVQSCVLEEIFGRREGKCGSYAARTSSAKWDADEITLIEKRRYRHQMGYHNAL